MPSPVLPSTPLGEVGEDVHLGRVPPEEEGLVVLRRALHEVHRLRVDFLVDRLHALARQRSSVRDAAIAEAVNDPAWPESCLERWILGIVGVLGFLLGIEVIEVAEELIEAVRGRQHVISVAKMVLSELPRCIALRLEQRGERRVFLAHALGGAGKTYLRQARPDRGLTGDERRTAGGAALLAVPIGEDSAFTPDAVDVGRSIAHHAEVVGADVELPDVVTPDDEDVGLARGLLPRVGLGAGRGDRGEEHGDHDGDDGARQAAHGDRSGEEDRGLGLGHALP